MSLRHLAIPQHPPGCDEYTDIMKKAAIVNQKFPPRGYIQLLEDSVTHPEHHIYDRINIEEYVIDTLHVYHQDRFKFKLN